MSTYIIATDGACPNNGNYSAEVMGMGVCSGLDNSNNQYWSEWYGRISNQRAELSAAIRAMVQFYRPWRYDYDLPSEPNRVVIKTDSAYVVGCMTDWICKWERNGFVTCKGKEGANGADPAAFDFQLVPTGKDGEEQGIVRRAVAGGKTHHFAVKTRDERIDWMRELMLAKALRAKGEGFEVQVNGNSV